MRNILRNWTAIACLAATTATACPAASTVKQAVFCEGQDYFYNSEYHEASAVFDRYIALDPSDPVGYWRKLLAELFILRRGGKIDHRALTMLAQTGIEKAEIAVHAGKMPDLNRYVEAAIMSILAAMQYKHGSENGKAHDNIIQAIKIAEQSAYQDAGFLIGSISYEASKSAAFYHPFLSLFGIPHDREKGRTMIFESAVQNDSPFVDDISFMIFSIETEKGSRMKYEKREVETLWNHLIQKYPRNKALLEFGSRSH